MLLHPQLQSLRHVSQLCLGFSHSMAVGKYGDTTSWGTDEHGSLGQGFTWPKPGSRTPQRLPLRLAGGAAGWQHSAGARWRERQLRHSMRRAVLRCALLWHASGPHRCSTGTCGTACDGHNAGFGSDGRLFTWGWGGAVGAGGLVGGSSYDLGAGQLGHGDDGDVYEPKQVQRLLFGRNRFRDLRSSVGGKPWHCVAVAAARNHTAAVIEADIPPSELE